MRGFTQQAAIDHIRDSYTRGSMMPDDFDAQVERIHRSRKWLHEANDAALRIFEQL